MAALDPPDRFPTKVYVGSDRENLVGHLETALRVTNTNLYSMVEIVCKFTEPFHIEDTRRGVVRRDQEALEPGNFFIITGGGLLFFLMHYCSLLNQHR